MDHETTNSGIAQKILPSADSAAASLRDKKIAELKASIESIKCQITETNSKSAEMSLKLEADASSIVARHIQLLHDFNEIRDVGLGLIGMVAEGRRLRLQDVMGEFGVGPED